MSPLPPDLLKLSTIQVSGEKCSGSPTFVAPDGIGLLEKGITTYITSDERLGSPTSELTDRTASCITVPLSPVREDKSPPYLASSPKSPSLALTVFMQTLMPITEFRDIALEDLAKMRRLVALGKTSTKLSCPINYHKNPSIVSKLGLDPITLFYVKYIAKKESEGLMRLPIVFKEGGLQVLVKDLAQKSGVNLKVVSNAHQIAYAISHFLKQPNDVLGLLVNNLIESKDPYTTPLVVLKPAGKPLQIVSLDPLKSPLHSVFEAIKLLNEQMIELEFFQQESLLIERESQSQVFAILTALTALKDLELSEVTNIKEYLNYDEESLNYEFPLQWSIARDGHDSIVFDTGCLEHLELFESLKSLRSPYFQRMLIKLKKLTLKIFV
jgi:hypothetical protein